MEKKHWPLNIEHENKLKIFFLNQNDVVLVKKKNKSQRVATEFFYRVTLGFSFPYFFFNLARFQPRIDRVLGRPAESGFKTMQNP